MTVHIALETALEDKIHLLSFMRTELDLLILLLFDIRSAHDERFGYPVFEIGSYVHIRKIAAAIDGKPAACSLYAVIG